MLSVVTEAVPEVDPADSVHMEELGYGFWSVSAHYGFMQSPDLLQALRVCRARGLPLVESDTSFYLGRETLLSLDGHGMAQWRKRLFRFLSRNSRSATDFFALPVNRVVEIGSQIEL
jgi:KUP system potassium uptake protein